MADDLSNLLEVAKMFRDLADCIDLTKGSGKELVAHQAVKISERAQQEQGPDGERLIEVKAWLGHGRFGGWLVTEFDWSEQTARNLMNVADAFKSTKFVELDFAPSALVALSAPSVPEPARQEAVALLAGLPAVPFVQICANGDFFSFVEIGNLSRLCQLTANLR